MTEWERGTEDNEYCRAGSRVAEWYFEKIELTLCILLTGNIPRVIISIHPHLSISHMQITSLADRLAMVFLECICMDLQRPSS